MNKPKTRTKDLVIRNLQEERLIYDLKENSAYCLNETSALIWQLCNGKRSAFEIAVEMNKELSEAITEQFVEVGLDQLSRNGLLEDGEQDYLIGVSRREAIRKAGFASMVALPLISSVVAPMAANAQSGGKALGEVCMSPPECISGTTCLDTFPVDGIGVCCHPSAQLAVLPGGQFTNPNPSFPCSSLVTACCSFSIGDTPDPAICECN